MKKEDDAEEEQRDGEDGEERPRKMMMVNGLEVNQEPDDPEDIMRESGVVDEVPGECWSGVGAGGYIDPVAINAAKMEEITVMRNIGVFEPASREECVEKTGHQPVSVK